MLAARQLCKHSCRWVVG